MSGYRDDREGLRLRVRELEQENEELRQQVAELRGESTAGGSGSAAHWFVGKPLGLELESVVHFDFRDDALEAVAKTLMAQWGRTRQVGDTLTASLPRNTSLTLTPIERGRGRLRVSSNEGRLLTSTPSFVTGTAMTLGWIGSVLLAQALGFPPKSYVYLVISLLWPGLGLLALRAWLRVAQDLREKTARFAFDSAGAVIAARMRRSQTRDDPGPASGARHGTAA